MNPQLWAEDGQIFLRDEWVIGFPDTILILYAGYIHLVPRVIAFIANFFPYELIPFVFNFSAILIAAFSVSIFSISRYRYIIKSDFLRSIVVILICFAPVGIESIGNVTNVHFYLSFGVFLYALIGGKLNGFSYIGIFIYVLFGMLSAPLAICYIPLFLIRPILCTTDRLRWIFGVIFLLTVGYLISMFYLGTRGTIAEIDWKFLSIPLNIEKLIRVSFSIYFINPNSLSFVSYFKYFWILEILFLFFYFKTFEKNGIQNTLFFASYLVAIFVPILLRGGLVLNEEQTSFLALVNGTKDSLYFLNVINLLVNRYGIVPYFIFCISVFSVMFNGEDIKRNFYTALIVSVIFLVLVRNSIFIKPFDDLKWNSYATQVRNKDNVVIPINPFWFPNIQIKKEEWR
ncbi:hypothetical protein [Leptospira perdikensis]|uniref:DUF2079 domain-containing protein n=1 Tax=Leptospira perdikensis TaxID=2484948 RepID=A0A4R9JCA3_9LEPT|nr:hypothetical protein [Leptospira perdikensis]TGL35725.1 hypothetical protein EHQ49_16880 [Leptospira perdikensis]